MGIPSYYRKLLRTHRALVQKAHPGTIDWLWMDFNCLIYHTLRRLEPYTKANQVVWEQQFLKEIEAYLKKVVAEVKPTKGVYIAVDGVVPMAKMRQQRLRRFKSSWLTANGLAEGQVAGQERWDTNAITPGTAFMASLKKMLEGLCRSKKGWSLSSSDEPGEGEHKVMAKIRETGSGLTHAVYGLDADLIVLSLLTQNTLKVAGKEASLWLFREQVEEGAMVRDAFGEEQFQWFSINGLRDVIAENIPIRDYCCAMSFLGNDFLPSSLGLKMRDDGHDVLMDLLVIMKGKGLSLVAADDSIDLKGLAELLRLLSASEENRVEQFVKRKLSQGRIYVNLPIGDLNWALAQKEEACLLQDGHLRSDWTKVYREKFLEGIEVEVTCQVYMQGLHWIWNYYRGREICYNWYYAWDLPPLWSELLAFKGSYDVPLVVKGSDILPVEQLCLVLPPASWHLVPTIKHRTLMQKAPYLFPKSFHFESVGKRWFWECEAKIPIPSIREVKTILG
jgi:5'-3' exonuclease